MGPLSGVAPIDGHVLFGSSMVLSGQIHVVGRRYSVLLTSLL